MLPVRCVSLAVCAVACANSERVQTLDSGVFAGNDAALTSDGVGWSGVDPQTCTEAAASKSYVGCDYWPTVVANLVETNFHFVVAVANAGSEPADVTVTGTNGVDVKQTVAPGTLARLQLPWVDTLKNARDASVVAPMSAYHLVSSRPVTVYQFNPLEYKIGTTLSHSNDASLLLPSTALTGAYRIITLPERGGPGPIRQYFAITGTVDGTNVTVKVGTKSSVVGGSGVVATAPGQTLTLAVNAGDVVELFGDEDSASDLSGTLVLADKPVQVIAGSPCTENPGATNYCDHIEESILPAETLGTDYVVTVPTAPGGAPIGHTVSIVGNVDGTNLTYFPAPPPGAPNAISAGDVFDLGIVNADFEVKGDHSFAVASFMLSGALVDDGYEGDPSQTSPVPVEQWRTRYIFLAPDDYDVSYADIVAPNGSTMTIDGLAVTTAPTALVGSSFDVYRVKLTTSNGGAHVLESSQPAGIQVIGYGNATSYEYPGGLNLAAISPPPPR